MTDSTGSQWTQVPPAPKTPNFWHGYGYTLMYASPGWNAYHGTFSTKADKPDGDPLFHARKAADAKAWAEANPYHVDKLMDEAKVHGGGGEIAKPKTSKPRKPRSRASRAAQVTTTDVTETVGKALNGVKPAEDPEQQAAREARAAKMRAENSKS